MVSRSDAIALLSIQGKKSVHTIIHGMYAYEFHNKNAIKGLSLTHTRIDILFTIYSYERAF